MSSCKGCGVSEERDFCDLCHVLIPAIGGSSLHLVPKDHEMNSAVSRIGLKRGHKGIFWSELDLNLRDSIDWIKSPREIPDSHWIIDPPGPWNLDDEMKEEIENGRDFDGNFSARRRLQRGGILPDGSYLTWANGQFLLDGIPISVPYLTLEKLVQQDGAEEFDWRSFLLSLNIACSRIAPNPRRAQFLTEGRRYGKQVSLHPVVHYIKPEFINQEFGRELAFLNRHNRDVNLAIPKRVTEPLQWFRRWTHSLEIRDFQRNDLLVCRTLQIRRGRIYLHMRQEMKWKTRRIPANIELISRLLNCALSPISHEDFQFQYHTLH